MYCNIIIKDAYAAYKRGRFLIEKIRYVSKERDVNFFYDVQFSILYICNYYADKMFLEISVIVSLVNLV